MLRHTVLRRCQTKLTNLNASVCMTSEIIWLYILIPCRSNCLILWHPVCSSKVKNNFAAYCCSIFCCDECNFLISWIDAAPGSRCHSDALCPYFWSALTHYPTAIYWCQRNQWVHKLYRFESRYAVFHSGKLVWKCYLLNFFQATFS